MNERSLNTAEVSVIIPVYNTEKYLRQCVESLMHQGDLHMEIILVDDGSTDRSGIIADQLALHDSRIKVIHRENGGASAARNAGLEIAQGSYIAFVDSDDLVKKDALCELYRTASLHQADAVMGLADLDRHSGGLSAIFKLIPKDMMNVPLSGKEIFVRSVKAGSYVPMIWSYVYRREFLENIKARFEEGIMHEDEIWTPVVLYNASKVVIADLDYYFYRWHSESVMHASHISRRVYSLFCVTDRLFEFAGQFDFSGADSAFKNWLYVVTYRLYRRAFQLLSGMKDASCEIPELHFDRFRRDCEKMMPETRMICADCCMEAEERLKTYIDRQTIETAMNSPPLISCLCVTHKKPDLLKRAIFCFENQSYPNRQLVVVYEESDMPTHDFLTRQTFDDNIKIVKVERDTKLTLGELRNLSVGEAGGSYVCQWDDDDWYDADRLTEQMKFLMLHKKSGCVLTKWVIYDSVSQKAYLSFARPWEGSILCRRDVMLQNQYPPLPKGEDLPVIDSLYKKGELAFLDMPQLYVYTFNGKNTWDYEHFSEIFSRSEELSTDVTQDIKEVIFDCFAQDNEKPVEGTQSENHDASVEDAKKRFISDLTGCQSYEAKYPDYFFSPVNIERITKLKRVDDFSLKYDSEEWICHIGGLDFVLNSAEELYILQEVFVEGVYNVHVNQPFTLIDIGMNAGITSLFFANKPACKRVVAFEPFQRTIAYAEKNLERNEVSAKIKVNAYGLGYPPRTVHVKYTEETKGSVGIINKITRDIDDKESISGESLIIRDVFEALNEIVDEKIILKIDCEGSEYEILERLNSTGLLSRFEIIMTEWHFRGSASLCKILLDNHFHVLSTGDHNVDFGMVYAFKKGV